MRCTRTDFGATIRIFTFRAPDPQRHPLGSATSTYTGTGPSGVCAMNVMASPVAPVESVTTKCPNAVLLIVLPHFKRGVPLLREILDQDSLPLGAGFLNRHAVVRDIGGKPHGSVLARHAA